MARSEKKQWIALLFAAVGWCGCEAAHQDDAGASGLDAGDSGGGTDAGAGHGDAHVEGGLAEGGSTGEGGLSDASSTDADAAQDGGGAELHWFQTCGAPLCGPSTEGPTGQPLCTDERVGDACAKEGALCDPSLGCGVNLVCAASDPKLAPGGCPISRARFKEGIRYLRAEELAQVADLLLQTPLAEWRYKGDHTRTPQFGFIIEDVEPSFSVAGDQVNLYGYTSMAVAALKVQREQVRSLESRLMTLESRLRKLEQSCGEKSKPELRPGGGDQ